MSRMKKAASPSPTASTQIDRQLAQGALSKRRAGLTPTARELQALRRVERAREEEQRWAYYESIPKGHWREMAGRQSKILNEQAARYGIPFGGRIVNLPKVVTALHDFLAANAQKLAADDGEDPTVELRREKANLARLDRLERERVLLPRDMVHEGLARIAGVLRTAGEALQRQFGPEAHRILEEALDDAQREIDSLCGDIDADGQPGDS